MPIQTAAALRKAPDAAKVQYSAYMTGETSTQIVLRGLNHQGYSSNEIARLLQISPAAVSAMRKGTRDLTVTEQSRLERATGSTVSQVAASAVEPAGGKLTDMLNDLVEATHRSSTPARVVKA